jgi:hypothetical protein
MPPKENGDALPKEKVALIAKWIEQGAKLDAGIEPKADLMRELRVRWQPPQPPALYKFPFLVNALAGIPAAVLAWPLDSVVLATHSRHGAPAYFPWQFWIDHPSSDLKSMIAAMYDKLKSLDQMAWYDAICGGKYQSIAATVRTEKMPITCPTLIAKMTVSGAGFQSEGASMTISRIGTGRGRLAVEVRAGLRMLERGGGAIVNIASIAGLVASPHAIMSSRNRTDSRAGFQP